MHFNKIALYLFVLISFSSFFHTVSFAGQNVDAGLYDPVAPAGSAFVRFYGNEKVSTLSVKGKTYPALDGELPSPYYVIKAGNKVKITTGAGVLETDIESGAFYTLIAGQTPILLKDETSTDKTKALISLYNLTQESALSLVTADKNIPVIENVTANATGARAINPLKLTFAVAREGKTLKTLDEKILDRGQSYSVFAIKKGDALDLVWAQNTTNTRQ